MLLRASSALMLLIAGQVYAGTIIKTANRDLANDREIVATSYAQQGSLRIESGNANGTVLIFKDNILYTLNTQKQTYIQMDRASLQRMVEQLGPAMKRMQDMLSMVPPEQRAALEKKFGIPPGAGSGKPSVQSVRKTGRNEKVAGYACSISESLRDDVVSGETCVAASKAVPGSQEFLDASSQVVAFLKAATEGVDSPWIRQIVDGQLEDYSQLDGIPVRTRRFDAGKPVTESTLQTISTKALPATLFEVPAGYTKKDLPGAR
jgi:hypothetical protein